MEDIKTFAIENLHLALEEHQLQQLHTYQETLIDWNTRLNLTAIRTADEIKIKHFFDSMYCLRAFSTKTFPNTLIDIGTGAGFPGIVLKIVLPDIQLTLVDSVGKKLEFCKHIVDKLSLANVKIVNDRVESLAHNKAYREQYDVAIARAVAPLPILSEYLLPFVKLNGQMVAMKGIKGEEEIETAKNAFMVLGGKFSTYIPYTLPDEEQSRMLIVVTKDHITPKQYPREIGLPKKQPL